jgi:hypothetical protein
MPHIAVAEVISMRVAGVHVGRDVAGEVPFLARAGEREIDGGEIARVIAVAGPEQHGDQIAGLQREIFDGTGFRFLVALRDAGREALAHRSAAQFQRPRDAVAARDMHVLHDRFDPEGPRNRAAPACGDLKLGRRMHREAVRPHGAGNADFLIGRVRNDGRRIGAGPPAFDEVVFARRDFHGKIRVDLHRARGADGKVIEPRGEHVGRNAVALGDGGDPRGVGRGLRHRDFVGGGEALRGVGHDAFAAFTEAARQIAHGAQRNFRTARRDETRAFPHDKIARIAVPRIAHGEVKRDLLVAEGRRHLETKILARDKRRHRFLPRLGSIRAPDLADGGKFPKRLLPLADLARERSGVGGFGGTPARAEGIEEERRLGAVESGPQRAKILRVDVVLLRHGVDRLGPFLERVALRERDSQKFFHAEAAAGIRVELDALQIHLRRAAGVAELAIHAADLREDFLGPIAARGGRGKAEAVRQPHGVIRDGLGGIEVFREQGGDITSALPVFVKPSPAAPSTGNSRAGSSASTPVRSRSVYVYSELESRRSTTGPGSPAWVRASSASVVWSHAVSRVFARRKAAAFPSAAFH